MVQMNRFQVKGHSTTEKKKKKKNAQNNFRTAPNLRSNGKGACLAIQLFVVPYGRPDPANFDSTAISLWSTLYAGELQQ